jgi:hypothetical protein
MEFRIYSSRANSYAKFVFWSQEDRELFSRTTDYFGPNVVNPDENSDSTKLESINSFKQLEEKYILASSEESNLMTPFYPAEDNLYFLLGEGHLKITYADNSEQIVENLYPPSGWVNYADVWQYNKDCYFHLYGDAHLLHVKLPENLTRSQYSIKVASIKHESGPFVSLTRNVENTDNQVFIYSPLFNFNAKNYGELDAPKGMIKPFKNQGGFTLKTTKFASAIYMEKL